MNIFSIHAGRTDFLKPHVEYLRYYCKDEFNYFCIDNFINQEQIDNIRKQCEELGVNYIRPVYSRQGNGFDHAIALNTIKDYTTDDVINVIYEFDVFLTKKFSFVDYIEDYDISGIYQQRNEFELEYIAPFIVIVNKNCDFSNINFNGAPGCDVGCCTSKYIMGNRKVKWMEHTTGLINNIDINAFLDDYDINYGCQIIESSFLHYYRGTNWNRSSSEMIRKKTEWFFSILEKSKTQEIYNSKYLSKYQTLFSQSFRHWNGSEEVFKSKLNPYYEN
jgi:hypothetical protein